MTRNIHEPTFPRSIRQNTYQTKGQRQKPLASHWVTPDCDASSEIDAPTTSGECRGTEPELQNGFAQPTGSLEPFSFRKHYDGSLEFKGHLDVENASSGDIAFTLPGENDGEPDYRLDNDQWFTTIVVNADGNDFMSAAVLIEAAGDVSIFWPAFG